MPDDIEQALISALRATGSLRRRLDLQVNKQDMTGGIRLTAPDDVAEPDEQLWTSLGFNTGALALVTDMNENLAQPPALAF